MTLPLTTHGNPGPLNRRVVFKALAGAAALALFSSHDANAVSPQQDGRSSSPAIPQQPASGTDGEAPETAMLRRRIGFWDVIETTWEKPGSKPVVTPGLVAERHMVGPMLQEFLRMPGDVPDGKVSRIDYVRFNDMTCQWEYVSLETRADIGIMPAKSFTRSSADRPIELIHDPFVIPGSGKDKTVLLRMKSVLTYQDSGRDEKEQYFVATDGTGEIWLAHKYAYRRRG